MWQWQAADQVLESHNFRFISIHIWFYPGIFLEVWSLFAKLSTAAWVLLLTNRSRWMGSPVVKTSPSSTGSVNFVPNQGAEIPLALQPKKQNIKWKQYCNKFNKDFKELFFNFLKRSALIHRAATFRQKNITPAQTLLLLSPTHHIGILGCFHHHTCNPSSSIDSFFIFLYKIVLKGPFSKVFIEFFTLLLLLYVFVFLAPRNVES